MPIIRGKRTDAPNNGVLSGGSGFGNALRGIPLIGGMLGDVGDIVSGVGNILTGSFGTGLSEIGGGVGGLAQIGITDAAAGVIGAVGYAYTKVADVADVLSLGSVFGDGALGSIGRLAQDTLIPDYGMFGGPHWGTDQGRGQSSVMNWVDENSYQHDQAFGRQVANASLHWVQSNWTPTPSNYVPPGPIGIIYTLLGTGPFSASNAVLGY